jgi:hypothetical protein
MDSEMVMDNLDGKMVRFMLDNGKKVKKMGQVFGELQMAINTMVNGVIISNKVLENILIKVL